VFKRPPYISILVGFLSIFCVVMVFYFLHIVFTTGPADDTGAPSVQTPEAKAAADVAAVTAEVPVIPKPVMPFIGLAYSIIAFVCTVNMLEGANWARWLYTVSFLLLLICYILEYSEHFLPFVPALVARGFVIPFLFFPGANDFFRSQD
jgi:hypothetical protein